jgi:hypothetical protein
MIHVLNVDKIPRALKGIVWEIPEISIKIFEKWNKVRLTERQNKSVCHDTMDNKLIFAILNKLKYVPYLNNQSFEIVQIFMNKIIFPFAIRRT